jgi:MFS family permease
VGRLQRTFWILFAGMLVNRLGGFVFTFLALYLVDRRGFTPARAGLVVSALGVGSVVAGLLGGWIADRFGRRAALLVSLVGGAAAMLQLGAARGLAYVVFSAFVVGLVGEMYRPAVHAAVADLVPPEERSRAFGYLYWAVNLGFACAASLAGFLARRSYWLLFAGDAATTLAFAFVVLAFVPETYSRPSREERLEGLEVPLRDWPFLAFIGLMTLLALIFQQGFVALPLDMVAHGITPEQFGWLIAINGVLIVVLQPLGIGIAQRFGNAPVLAVSSLLVGIGFGATALARTPIAYALTICTWTFGEILFSPVAPTVVADLSPAHLRGTYQGVYQMSWGAAFCLAPVIGSGALQRYGSATLWGGCLALGAIVGAAHLAAAKARRHRPEDASIAMAPPFEIATSAREDRSAR